MLITWRLTATRNEAELGASLTRLIAKSGEPLIRKGVDMAMRVMGGQFVTGETISEALENAERLEKKGFLYSLDMLGEAALTEEDTVRYLKSYENAIHAIGKRSAGRGIYDAQASRSNCRLCIRAITEPKSNVSKMSSTLVSSRSSCWPSTTTLP